MISYSRFLFRKTGMICAVVGKAAAALRELPVWFITYGKFSESVKKLIFLKFLRSIML